MAKPRILHPREVAQRTPDRLALVMADTGETLTYGELVENADRAAQLLQRLGLVEADTIAILLENHIRYPELCWAAKNSGIRYACVSSHLNTTDAAYIVNNSDAKLLISSKALAQVAQDISTAAERPLIRLMIDGTASGFSSYETELAKESPVPVRGRRRGGSLLYSSGTTGSPKGVRVPLPDDPPEIPPARHGLLVRQFGIDHETAFLNPGPFYHAAPGRFMMCVQREGGTVVGLRKFDPTRVLSTIEELGVTHGFFVPTMFNRLLALEDKLREDYGHASLRCVIHGAAPCPVGIKERMIEWWRPIIQELYGGTESLGHTFITSEEWLRHKGSVGRPAAGCRVRIVDDNGQDVPAFTPGRIYFSNGTRFEYYKDPEKTRGVFLDSDWGTFGDIGYVDDEGYLYLTDRAAHMIISGGVNIYPQEAENVLSGHPAVADVAVIGVPNADFGEEVKAVVQPVTTPADADALERELITYCRERLSPIKCPRSVDFVDSLPRSEAGKLLKREIKKVYWAGRERPIG